MAFGVDNSLRLEDFKKSFKVEVKYINDDDMEFDMIGIDAALANAFRRILLAEVGGKFSVSHLAQILILSVVSQESTIRST